MDINNCDAKNFCTCPVEKCPRHPKNHSNGCNHCIQDNLKRGKMPACFFALVHEDTSDARDFTIEGFVDYFTKHKESYTAKSKINPHKDYKFL